MSPSIKKLRGYEPEELIGTSFFEGAPPGTREKIIALFEEELNLDASGQASPNRSRKMEVEMYHKDGSMVWVESNASFLRDENQKIIGVIGINRDVTERKRIEETVLREKRFSDTLINSLPGIFYLFTVEGKFLRWNQNFETVSEYSATEIKKMTPEDLFEGDEKEYIRKQIQEVFTTGRGDAEANLVSKTGRRIPHYFTGLLIHIDNQPHLIGMGIDITERKVSEEALKKSQEQYRGVVENANDAIVILHDGMIVFHNQKTESLTGYSAKDLSDTPFINFIAPDDQERVLERYQRKLNGEVFGDGAFGFWIIDKNENKLWVESNIALVPFEGETAIQCFLRDATFQKKIEAQLRQAQKLEAIGTLAGGIAHDFNNILSIILGNLELAMFNIPDWSPVRKNLEETKKACFMAIEVVRQILSFSRQMEQEQKPVNLCTIILESLKLLRSSIPTTIEIRHDIPETPYSIIADPAQINQVIINLCTNAAHAMKETGGVLEIGLQETILDVSTDQTIGLSPGRYVQVSVKDTGPGIDSEIINRIFDPYFTTKKAEEGSGLGLATVHGIVKNHGGAITVKSEPNHGSDFQIFFPKAQQHRAKTIEMKEKLLGGTETILFVDDEASLAEIGKQMLTFLGYEVEARTRPIDALKLFKANPHAFDLVITDMTMPQMTGKSLAKELIRIRPDIPIILNTGHSDQIDESSAKAIGIMAYIMKPMNMTVLSQTIRKLLDSQ